MTLEAKAIIEKQPDWIDKARNHYLYDSDGEIPSKETIYSDSINPNIIESKKAFRDGIELHLPKETSYEDGYKKKIRKLKNQWTATRRKRKGCSYEEDRCMLTIINDLEFLLSPTDTK